MGAVARYRRYSSPRRSKITLAPASRAATTSASAGVWGASAARLGDAEGYHGESQL